jgi:hypothetical protein
MNQDAKIWKLDKQIFFASCQPITFENLQRLVDSSKFNEYLISVNTN